MHHPRIDVGLAVGTSPPVRNTRWMVRGSKALGASSVWLVDHLTGFFPESILTPDFTWMARSMRRADAFFDWQVAAGHLSTRIGRARLGIGVTEAIRRHPVILAQAALSLSHFTARPPILGMGAGEAENVVPYGLAFERPVSRFEEALKVIRLCFDADGPLGFQGEFYNLDRASFALKAGKGGRPDIWVAAHGPRMLDLTGRFGDGWYPALTMSPERYAESLGVIKKSAVDAGRDPEGIVASMRLSYLIGRDDADIDRQLNHPAIRFMALLAPDMAWNDAGSVHPLGAGFGGLVDFVPDRYKRDQLESAIAAVPAEVLRRLVVAGTLAQVVSRVRELADAGLRHVVLSPISPLVSRRAFAFTIRTLPGIVRRLRTGEG